MIRFLSSQGLCKALAHNERNFLDMPSLDDPVKLMYDKIFPYYRVPDSENPASSYILMSFRNFRLVKNKFKSGQINIFTLTHKDLVRTDYGFLRYDYMLEEVDKILNSQDGIGIGKTEFVKMDEWTVNNELYIGNVIAYKIYEWN